MLDFKCKLCYILKMPNREQILSHLAKLEEQSCEEKPDPKKSWVDREDGVRFEFAWFSNTKPPLLNGKGFNCIILEVKGNKTGRKQKEQNFKDVLGKPAGVVKGKTLPGIMVRHEDVLIWKASKVLKLQSKQ
jgi:hypothetical protein